jgi:transposase
LGRSRGGLSTKIHMLADALGRPLRFVVTGGQVTDCTQADRLLENVKTEYVIADKGYDSEGLLRKIEELGAVAVVPPRSNRKVQREYDRDLYKRRNLIERTFNKLKRFRRLATRYDRKAIYFGSFLYLAASLLWL